MEQAIGGASLGGVWIGLVGVLPLKEDTFIAGAKGAYVNALSLVGTVTALNPFAEIEEAFRATLIR